MPGPPARIWTPEECDLVRELVAEGRTQRWIADAMGVSHQSIHRLAMKLDIVKLEGQVAANRRRLSKSQAEKSRQRDAQDALRIRVYEAALGRTREQLATAVPDVPTKTVDAILADLASPKKITGNWYSPVLTTREDGTFIRTKDDDMTRWKSEERKRRAGIRRLARPGALIHAA